MLLLTSCENFLKANQVKSEIEESIEIANSSPILYHIIADKDSGTVSPSQATLKKKQSVNLLFTPAEGCTFIRWEVRDRSSGELVPDAIKFDNPKNPETKALIVKPRENLMICPKCTLVPAVIQITPVFESGGCDQDTAIEIIFNKAVDTLTFDFDNISITSAEGTELFSTDPDFSFFDMPYFSEDNKVLTIPTIKGKFLLLPDGVDEGTTIFNSKKTRDDITVYLDLYGVKDSEGLDFKQVNAHTYRVNKNIDNVAPEIQDIQVYSTSDTNNRFFKELTQKDYSDWSNKYGGSYKLNKGDFTRNHVSHLYITLYAYDEKSEIKNIRVKETYARTKVGEEVTSLITSNQVFGENDFETGIDEDGFTFCSMEYEFDKRNVDDGLYKIEISILDAANNESAAETYWVIKDSVSNPRLNIITGTLANQNFNVSNAKQFIEYPVYNSANGNYEVEYKFEQMVGTDLAYRIYLGDYDTYYTKDGTSFISYRNITGILEEEGSEPVTFMAEYLIANTDTVNLAQTITNKLKKYKRNARKNTTVKFIVEEESGLINEYSQTFLKSVDFLGFENNTPICSSMADSYEGEQIYPITVVKYQADEDAEEVETVYNNYPSKPTTTGIYTYYVFRKCGAFYSCLGRPYKYYVNVEGGAGNETNVVFPTFELPEYSKNEILYETNAKTAKFNIQLTYAQDTSTNYKYSIFLNGSDTLDKFTFESEANNPNLYKIEVPSNDDYLIYLLAFDNDGNFVKRSGRIPESGVLSLKDKDNTPPNIQSKFPIGTTGALENYVESNVFRSNDIFPTGYEKNVDNDRSPKAWFYYVPTGFKGGIEDIKDYPRREVLITSADRANHYIDIPFDGLEYGKYCIYTLVYDQSQNYSLQKCDGNIIYYTAVTKPVLNALSDKIKICSSPLTEDICQGFSLDFDEYTCYTSVKTLQNGKWNDSVIHAQSQLVEQAADDDDQSPVKSWDYEISYPDADSFIKICGLYRTTKIPLSESYAATYNMISMKPVYAYTGYYKYLVDWKSAHPDDPAPAYCMSKTWMPMANGWQIFNDKPCFVHTMCCSKNLTQSGNYSMVEAALEWETRGWEKGVVYSDGTNITFSYTDENLEGVPEDYYYTTICHFADGTVVMSEVKQKK